MSGPKPSIEPESIRLFYEPEGRLRMTIGEHRSYLAVKPVWAAPLSFPGRYLALLDGKGQEIVMFDSIDDVPAEPRKLIEEELYRRYLTPTVLSIESARSEFGVSYWTVVTDRGRRDFVTQNLSESVQWLSPAHLLLCDVDGNRFDVPDVQALDPISRKLLTNMI